MKQKHLIENLEKEGYEVDYGKYEYWDNIPYVEHEDGSVTWIAQTYNKLQSTGVKTDLPYEKVKEAIDRKAHDLNDLNQMLSDENIEKRVEEMISKLEE